MKTIGTLFALACLCGAAQAQDQPPTQPPPTTTTALGGPGESCRARADCKAGLKCVSQTCTDEHEGETCGATSDCGGELKCINHQCTSTLAGHGGGGGANDDWMAFKITDGAPHPFVGLTAAGGFGTLGATGNGVSGGFNVFDGAGLFALHGGVFIGRNELMFEIAPITFAWDTKVAPGPVFEMNASYAYLLPIADSGNIHVYWPLRFGLGMAAGPDNNLAGLAFFQVRADVIGAAIHLGHVVIDLHLPSFRYLLTDTSGVQFHLLEWLFGTSVSYVF